LRGKETERFQKYIKNPGSISKEEYEEVKKVHEKIEIKKIKKAYDMILKHDLKPNTIVCAVCGNIYSLKNNKKTLCIHLREIFKDFL